ncbi:hypothetical protein FKM82_028018 [Ascaphus truei]
MVLLNLCPSGDLWIPPEGECSPVKMANVWGYTDDVWEEESLPGYEEIILQSQDVPVNGKIYVMFHGTTVEAAKEIIKNGFKRSTRGPLMLGPGVYVSRDKDKAARYPLDDKSDQVILKLRVNVGKVKKIDYQGHPLQKTWHEEGYDTAWVPEFCGMVNSGLEENCIWDPRRIKVVAVVKVPREDQHFLIELLKMYRK